MIAVISAAPLGVPPDPLILPVGLTEVSLNRAPWNHGSKKGPRFLRGPDPIRRAGVHPPVRHSLYIVGESSLSRMPRDSWRAKSVSNDDFKEGAASRASRDCITYPLATGVTPFTILLTLQAMHVASENHGCCPLPFCQRSHASICSLGTFLNRLRQFVHGQRNCLLLSSNQLVKPVLRIPASPSP